MKTSNPFTPSKRFKHEAQELVRRCQPNISTPEDLLKQLRLFRSFHVEQIDNEITSFLKLVLNWKPRVICEIGTYFGGSLFLLSQVSPDNALLISIDLDSPKDRQRAYQTFAREHQRIKCLEGDSASEKMLRKVKKILNNEKIDLLFIDGDHSFFGVANDFVRYSPLVKSGGFIAFHDINKDSFLKTGVRSTANVGEVPIFWDALKQTSRNFLEIIDAPDQDGYGIGILQKK